MGFENSAKVFSNRADSYYMSTNRQASSSIKKLFKQLGFDVSVRTVAVKHPFVQIWLNNGECRYDKNAKGFPNYIREAALKAYYNVESFEKLNVLNLNDIDYGNIRKHSLSLSVADQLPRFIELVNKTIGSNIAQVL